MHQDMMQDNEDEQMKCDKSVPKTKLGKRKEARPNMQIDEENGHINDVQSIFKLHQTRN